MIYYRLKHLCGNDLNKIIEDGNNFSMDLCNKGHEIRKIDIVFDKDSLRHNRKPSHSIIIHYTTQIKESPDENSPEVN